MNILIINRSDISFINLKKRRFHTNRPSLKENGRAMFKIGRQGPSVAGDIQEQDRIKNTIILSKPL